MKLDENTLAYSQSCLASDTEDEERTYFYQAAWGIWLQKHEVFYEKCSQISSGISADDIGNLFDDEMLELEAKIKSY